MTSHNKHLRLCVFDCSYEQAHFTVELSGKTGFWWIGLRAQGGASGGVDYYWDNGLPLTFTHWDKDQPGTYLTPTLVSARHHDDIRTGERLCPFSL